MGLQAGAPGGACKIYVLDIAQIAAEHGLPSCDVGNVVVDSKTQVRCRMAATPNMISFGPHQVLNSQLHEQARYPVSSSAKILWKFFNQHTGLRPALRMQIHCC